MQQLIEKYRRKLTTVFTDSKKPHNRVPWKVLKKKRHFSTVYVKIIQHMYDEKRTSVKSVCMCVWGETEDNGGNYRRWSGSGPVKFAIGGNGWSHEPCTS